jgi:hypothetical protein
MFVCAARCALTPDTSMLAAARIGDAHRMTWVELRIVVRPRDRHDGGA